MYIPFTREKVEIRGRTGEFFVMAVDYERQLADVCSLSATAMVEEVPFAMLAPGKKSVHAERPGELENLAGRNSC